MKTWQLLHVEHGHTACCFLSAVLSYLLSRDLKYHTIPEVTFYSCHSFYDGDAVQNSLQISLSPSWKPKLFATNLHVIWFSRKAPTSGLQRCSIFPAHCFLVGLSFRRHCQDFLLNVFWIQLLSYNKFHFYTQTIFPVHLSGAYLALYKYILSFSLRICQLHDMRNTPILFTLEFLSNVSNTLYIKDI